MARTEDTPDPTRHTVVFSDFHMSPASPDHPWWMRYRNRQFFVDTEFAALADRLLDEIGPSREEARLEVVFNGDLFELDGADAFVNGKGRRHAEVGSEETEAHALDVILADHAGFVHATARLMLRAERVVFLAGNHDVGLYWPAVQAVLRDHLLRAARDLGAAEPESALAERIVFRQWFHRTDGGVYIEHGQQYDPSSSLPDALIPTRGDGLGLWMSFGSAGFRHIMSGIGTMNPHDHNTFIMSGVEYARHWVRYYFRKSHSLVTTWLGGSIACARHMLGQRDRRTEPSDADREQAFGRLAEVTDSSPTTLRRLRALHARPVTDRPYHVLRELWLDRVAIAGAIGVVALLGLLLLPWPLDFVVTALAGLGFWLYERHAPPSDIMAFEDRLGDIALSVCELTGDRIVLLGHTHHAGIWELEGGVRLVNTGTWAPAFLDPECTVRAEEARPFAWIRSTRSAESARLTGSPNSIDGGTTDVDLLVWESGRFLAWSEFLERTVAPSTEGDQPEIERAA